MTFNEGTCYLHAVAMALFITNTIEYNLMEISIAMNMDLCMANSMRTFRILFNSIFVSSHSVLMGGRTCQSEFQLSIKTILISKYVLKANECFVRRQTTNTMSHAQQ